MLDPSRDEPFNHRRYDSHSPQVPFQPHHELRWRRWPKSEREHLSYVAEADRLGFSEDGEYWLGFDCWDYDG